MKYGEIKNRNISLDGIRALAALCVVINHAVEQIYSLKIDFIVKSTFRIKLFSIAGFTFGRIGVPLFLLLSGYLLLQRNYDKKQTIKFYKHNFLPLLIVWEIWIFIYSVFLSLFNQVPFDIQEYLRKVFFLEHAGLPHAWYMPMIIGIYLFIPYVASALQKMNGKMLLILLFVIYIYLYVIPGINLFQTAFQIPIEQRFNNQLELSFSGGKYGFYLILGYCFWRYKKRIDYFLANIKFYFIIIMLCAVTFLGTVYIQLEFYSLNYQYGLWYDFFLMPILGSCVFLSFMKLKWPIVMHSVLTQLSTCAFGIYLLHELILMPCIRKIGDVYDKSTEVVVLSIGVYFVSFVIVEILSLVPNLNKLFIKK